MNFVVRRFGIGLVGWETQARDLRRPLQVTSEGDIVPRSFSVMGSTSACASSRIPRNAGLGIER